MPRHRELRIERQRASCSPSRGTRSLDFAPEAKAPEAKAAKKPHSLEMRRALRQMQRALVNYYRIATLDKWGREPDPETVRDLMWEYWRFKSTLDAVKRELLISRLQSEDMKLT